MSRTLFALFLMLIIAGCGSETPGAPVHDGASTSDATFDTVPVSDDRGSSDVRLPGCDSNLECDDGVACTDDRCMDRVCRHTSDAARCASGQACDDRRGCVAGRACGTNAECADMDACTVRERCDPSARVCLSDRLDGDGDGEPPRSCGGNDCDDADPRRSPGRREVCDGIDNDCSGTADDNLTDCTETGAVCRAGRCECSDPQRIICGSPEPPLSINACVNVSSDPTSCGRCGFRCGEGACVNGECQCRAPTARCGAGTTRSPACTNLQTDGANCGRCGESCPAGIACVMGMCACPPGRQYCTSTTPHECFDSTAHQSDSMNCGACGVRCPVGSSCQAGRCVCTGAGDMLCGGECIYTPSSPANCGACGNACPRGVDCRDGRCGCFGDTTLCSSGCRTLQNDRMNCGTCGNVCPATVDFRDPSCSSGRCICEDTGGRTPTRYWCRNSSGDNVCINPAVDTNHCGRCGNACASGLTCAGGMCVCSGVFCNGVCRSDFASDSMNCGRCGNVCPAGMSCRMGRCEGSCPARCSSSAECAPCRLPGETNAYCCFSGFCAGVPLPMCP